MDYLRRRERRSILKDVIDLRKGDDDDDEYQQRRKEHCLVKVIYRNSNPRRRRKVDEVMVIQHHRVIFKGCLQNGGQFTFKSQRYRNESRIKIKFYINDFLEQTMIACCEYGFIDRNRPEHIFQIEKIVGAKPCHNCELDDDDDDDTLETSSSYARQSSSQKDPIVASKPKEKKNTTFIRQSSTNNKAPSESFRANLTEVSDHPTQQPDQNETNEDPADVVTSLPQTPIRPRYGPPQLSVIETPSPGVRQSPLAGLLFNSSATTQQQTTTDQPARTEPIQRQSSFVETLSNEPTSATSNSITTADITQLLLQQLGIIRQQQVERPEVPHVAPPREKGNVEIFTLIYLNESNPDESTIKRLRNLVNFVKIFNDDDDCIAFLNTVAEEKILLIVSYSFHQSVLPRIEELQQIFMIYILSENEEQLDIPSGNLKIRGAYINFDDMYERISDDINKVMGDLVLYFAASSSATSISSNVFYYLLLTEIILDKTEAKDDMKELINFVRKEYQDNDEELKLIDEFENSYKKEEAIAWLCRHSFVSKMLQRALLSPETDILYRFRSFLQHLTQQIQEESTSESITLYLSHTIKRTGLDNLQKNLLTDDLIIWPGFLVGSTDQDHAIRIAKEIPVLDENTVPLIIRVDISEDFKCASIVFPRYSNDEHNNVLVNMGTIGRLVKVEKDNIQDDQIGFIHLRLLKLEEQQNIQEILQSHRDEVKSFSPFTGMIKLMMQINQHALAEQLVQTMADDENLKSDANFQAGLATACLLLAQSHRTKGEFQQALDLFLLSLKVFQRVLSEDAEELSPIYSNIGGMYFRLADYEKSLEYYQKALKSQLNATTPDLYTIGSYTKCMGSAYSRQKKYLEAVQSFERTLKILGQCPEPHPTEVAATYDDLGETYLLLSKNNEAIENYVKALEIQERVEPCSPETLARLNNTLGNIYLKVGRSKEALIHLKRGLEYSHEVLPSTHSTFALLYNNLGLMYYREQQHDDAMRCYNKVLEIAAVSLPENHSLLGVTWFNIGLCYSGQEKYDEAIESMEKSTAQFLKTMPPDDPEILDNKKYIESIRQKKALRDIFGGNTTSS